VVSRLAEDPHKWAIRQQVKLDFQKRLWAALEGDDD